MPEKLLEVAQLNRSLLGFEEGLATAPTGARGFILGGQGVEAQVKALKKLGFDVRRGIFGIPASAGSFVPQPTSQDVWLSQTSQEVFLCRQRVIYDPHGWREAAEVPLYPRPEFHPEILSLEEILGLILAWGCQVVVEGRDAAAEIIERLRFAHYTMCANAALDTGRFRHRYEGYRMGLTVPYPQNWLLLTEVEPGYVCEVLARESLQGVSF